MRKRQRHEEIKNSNLQVSNSSLANEIREEQIVHGWESVEEAAGDIYSSIHKSLLEGCPVFLYKNTNDNTDLEQIVVVRNIDPNTGKLLDTYGVGEITKGWTALLPLVPFNYLTDVRNDLVKYKVDKKIIDSYDQVMEYIESNNNNETKE